MILILTKIVVYKGISLWNPAISAQKEESGVVEYEKFTFLTVVRDLR